MTDYKAKTIIQAIHYLLGSFSELNKLKIIKLLYLSDKYHLLFYGKTITNDEYYAMQYGPVGSITKNVLDFDESRIGSNNVRYTKSLVENFEEDYQRKDVKCNYVMLSETNKEAIDFAVCTFGRLTSFNLYKYTHKYPEWKQHDDFLKKNPKRRKKLNEKDLFSIIDNKFGITKQQAINSMKLFTEC